MEEILLTHYAILCNLFQSQLKLNANIITLGIFPNKLKVNPTQSSKETITIEQHC